MRRRLCYSFALTMLVLTAVLLLVFDLPLLAAGTTALGLIAVASAR